MKKSHISKFIKHKKGCAFTMAIAISATPFCLCSASNIPTDNMFNACTSPIHNNQSQCSQWNMSAPLFNKISTQNTTHTPPVSQTYQWNMLMQTVNTSSESTNYSLAPNQEVQWNTPTPSVSQQITSCLSNNLLLNRVNANSGVTGTNPNLIFVNPSYINQNLLDLNALPESQHSIELNKSVVLDDEPYDPPFKPYSWNHKFQNYKEKDCDPNYPRYSYTDSELEFVKIIREKSLEDIGVGKGLPADKKEEIIDMLIAEKPDVRIKRNYCLEEEDEVILEFYLDDMQISSFNDIADFLVKLLCNDSKDRWEFDLFDVTRYTNTSKIELCRFLKNHWNDFRRNMSQKTIETLNSKSPSIINSIVISLDGLTPSTNTNEITVDNIQNLNESRVYPEQKFFNRYNWNCNFKKYKENGCRADFPRFKYTPNELDFVKLIYNNSLDDIGIGENANLQNTNAMVKDLIEKGTEEISRRHFDILHNYSRYQNGASYSPLQANKLFIIERYLDNLNISSFDSIADFIVKLLCNESKDRHEADIFRVTSVTNNSKSQLCNLILEHWEDFRQNMSKETFDILTAEYPLKFNTTINTLNSLRYPNEQYYKHKKDFVAITEKNIEKEIYITPILKTLNNNGIRTKNQMFKFIKNICKDRDLVCPNLYKLKENNLAMTIYSLMVTTDCTDFSAQVKNLADKQFPNTPSLIN